MSDLEARDENRKNWRTRIGEFLGTEPADRTQLLGMLQDASQRNLFGADVLNLFHGALAAADMRTRDIMIPRSQVVTVRADARADEYVPELLEATHSRFPVIGEDMDDIHGILHAKDMLRLLVVDRDEFDIKDYIRPLVVVPESKRLLDLLQDFRDTRNHMAVVIDEYGDTAGVVTIEDVLEQIVGDIEDEYDVDDDTLIKELDGSWVVKAITPINDFNAHFRANFSDDEFDTIGGIVLKQFGYVPKRDDAVEVGGFRFRVLNADSRRVRLLDLTRVTPETV